MMMGRSVSRTKRDREWRKSSHWLGMGKSKMKGKHGGNGVLWRGGE